MTTNEPNRLDRMEAMLERVIRVQERMLESQERTDERIEILLNAATRHESTISRLDSILERLIYREGRNGDGSTENS